MADYQFYGDPQQNFQNWSNAGNTNYNASLFAPTSTPWIQPNPYNQWSAAPSAGQIASGWNESYMTPSGGYETRWNAPGQGMSALPSTAGQFSGSTPQALNNDFLNQFSTWSQGKTAPTSPSAAPAIQNLGMATSLGAAPSRSGAGGTNRSGWLTSPSPVSQSTGAAPSRPSVGGGYVPPVSQSQGAAPSRGFATTQSSSLGAAPSRTYAPTANNQSVNPIVNAPAPGTTTAAGPTNNYYGYNPYGQNSYNAGSSMANPNLQYLTQLLGQANQGYGNQNQFGFPNQNAQQNPLMQIIQMLMSGGYR